MRPKQFDLNTKGAAVPEETPNASLSDRAASGLAYLTVIPAIFFLLALPYKERPEVRFHSWQSIFLCIAWVATYLALDVLGRVIPVGSFLALSLVSLTVLALMSVATFLFFILWSMAIIKAFNGNRFKIAVIGNMAERRACV
jgi:uncharacterized membrane protein